MFIRIFAATLGLAAATAAADSPRYSAGFADGHRVLEGRLTSWHAQGQPRLDDRPLFDPGRPARWVRRAVPLPQSAPPAFVEFVGGDCLPGLVVGAGASADLDLGEQPIHLLVEPDRNLDWGETDRPHDAPPPRGTVRVAARWIRRIVFARRAADAYVPGTLFYRDGRQLSFRVARFAGPSVTLLTADSRREVPLDEIAELHLPAQDFWPAYFEQLLLVSPQLTARLIRVRTAQGLQATLSYDCLRPLHHGNPNESASWIQAIQPAWLLDPMFVRVEHVQEWLFYAPHEVPLSAVEPSSVTVRPLIWNGSGPSCDRNSLGDPLECGQVRFGWGIGIQAHSELAFDLPDGARFFRTRFGLDRAAGEGGCVRGAIYLHQVAGAPLFQTGYIVGSKDAPDSGPLPLKPSTGQPLRLILVADAAHRGRPAGADPFDIRDLADWLEPLVELDAEWLKRELLSRAPQVWPGLANWTVAPSDLASLQLALHFPAGHPTDARVRRELRPTSPFLPLSRRLEVGPRDAWLLLYVTRDRDPRHSPPCRVQVRLDGNALGDFDVPVAPERGDPAPIPISIRPYRGRPIAVEVLLQPDQPNSLVSFSSVLLAEHAPGLAELFEDELPPTPNQPLPAALVPQHFSGRLALAAVPARPAGPLPLPPLAIRERPRAGEYRYLRFAWKKIQGQEIALELAAHLDLGGTPAGKNDLGAPLSVRYHAGPPRAAQNPRREIRLADQKPDEWSVATRDLFQDLGEVRLSSLALEAVDGQSALLDYVYLARALNDFDRTPRPDPNDGPAPDPASAKARNNRLAHTEDPSEYGAVVAPILGPFAIPRADEGVERLRELDGRQNVARIQAVDPNRDLVLKALVDLPPNRSARLTGALLSHPGTPLWRWKVRLNGETLQEFELKPQDPAHWHPLDLDLSRFAGRRAVIELLARPASHSQSGLHIGRLAVETQ